MWAQVAPSRMPLSTTHRAALPPINVRSINLKSWSSSRGSNSSPQFSWQDLKPRNTRQFQDRVSALSDSWGRQPLSQQNFRVYDMYLHLISCVLRAVRFQSKIRSMVTRPIEATYTWYRIRNLTIPYTVRSAHLPKVLTGMLTLPSHTHNGDLHGQLLFVRLSFRAAAR